MSDGRAAQSRAPNHSTFEVVYCGAIGTLQKLDLIISSVANWPRNTTLALIGNDRTDIATALKQQVEQLGLGDRVRFEGWLPYPALRARLAAAALGILMLDTSYEQFRTALGASNKRYQYMQAGLPQIGDMNPGVADLLEGQGIGRCVRSFDSAELATAVAEYANNPERCAVEGQRAYELHRTTYNYERAFRPVLEWIGEQFAIEQAA
jgi:glycosyltransferase involved in cell wall biosynthesis